MHEQPGEVRPVEPVDRCAGVVERGVTGTHHGAVGEHDFEREQRVGDGAVPRGAEEHRATREPAADRRACSGEGPEAWQPQAVRCERVVDLAPRAAGLDGDRHVVGVQRDDAVESGQVDDDAALDDRRVTAAVGEPGTARHQRVPGPGHGRDGAGQRVAVGGTDHGRTGAPACIKIGGIRLARFGRGQYTVLAEQCNERVAKRCNVVGHG